VTVTLLRGDALHLPIADHTVDLVVTSPPYFGLRSYQDGCKSCANSVRSTLSGYMERSCPGCGQLFESGRRQCHKCGRATVETQVAKDARKAVCPDCNGTGKGHYPGQIGSEATPAEWVEAMLAATREMVRVLKPCGSIWVNLGDKYASGGRGSYDLDPGRREVSVMRAQDGARPKSLLGLPWRYALASIDQLGLILRAEVIWSKPNGLPESVTDRVRRSHETWFHFTVQPRYFSAVDETREPQSDPERRGWNGAAKAGRNDGLSRERGWQAGQLAYNSLGKLPGSVWSIPSQPLTVPPELGVDHFAAFPRAWPRRLIAGWSPAGICTVCGEGRRPVAEVQPQPGLNGDPVETRRCEPSTEQWRQIAAFIQQHRERLGLSRQEVSQAVVGTPSGACWWWENADVVRPPTPQNWRALTRVLALPDTWDRLMLDTYMRPTGRLVGGPALTTGRHQTAGTTGLRSSSAVIGYICACDPQICRVCGLPSVPYCGGFRCCDSCTHDTLPPAVPAVVLDPFGGTGTTALVAHVMGRHGISVDLSQDYCRLAAWRTTDPSQLAQAAQVDKPPVQTVGQDTLFEVTG
jgi:DNA modification methylase